MRWLRRAWHGVNVAVPRTSWSVYHPNAHRTALHPPTKLLVKRMPRMKAYTQTRASAELLDSRSRELFDRLTNGRTDWWLLL